MAYSVRIEQEDVVAFGGSDTFVVACRETCVLGEGDQEHMWELSADKRNAIVGGGVVYDDYLCLCPPDATSGRQRTKALDKQAPNVPVEDDDTEVRH